MSAWIALFILALGAMFLLADTAGTIAGVDSTTFGYVVLCVAIIVYLTGGMLSRYGGRATFILRDAVTWLALGLGLVTIYTYRETLLPMAGRVAGELIPGSAMTVEESSNGATEVRLRKRMDGHFVASVAVNGKSVSMIVDTGASEIVLRPEDAEQVGIDTTALSYTIPVHTANGRSMTARVRLDNVAIGPLDRRKVEALVAKPGALTQSLLGMSFLSRLRSYEFSGDFLTLRG
ncbi:MAG TPA: TIGR02281 family clan AA aspartic protease [Methyloceanibacter sp.]|jgi:aspartyl protease family protein